MAGKSKVITGPGYDRLSPVADRLASWWTQRGGLTVR